MAGKKLRIPSFTEDHKELLVSIVESAQRRRIKGKCGSWKEFLAWRCAASGSDPSTADPARHPWETLAEFVQTFSSEKDVEFARSMMKWHKWCLKNELAEIEDPWPETREQHLVNVTAQNPRFTAEYSFPSFKEGWIRIERGHSSDAHSPERLLSLDCEMVDCENDEKDVVQVCIVNRQLETLLDTIVRPRRKVINYLTHIHGITQDQLEKATCTQEEAQQLVKNLITPGTILVGHSLQNDLRALKIDYRRVIDTTFLFKENGKHLSFNIGLKKLCQKLLGYDFRDQGNRHSCLDDAIVPMKIVLQELENGSSDLSSGSKKKKKQKKRAADADADADAGEPIAKQPCCSCGNAEEVRRLQKLIGEKEHEVKALKQLVAGMRP